MRLKTFVFSLLFFSLAHSLWAENVTVQGRVTDNERKPLELVDVMVSGTSIGTSTDSTGHYKLTLETGSQTISLTFNLLGYKQASVTAKIKNAEARINAVLQDSVTALDGVAVTEVARQTGQTQTIDPTKASETPGAANGIEALIATQAGVTTTNELSSQYAVRGGNYDENCVYVNHIEVYRPLLIRAGEQEGLSFVNPDMVESLQFSTGGFSAEYGDKMSSVLDIQYKQPKSFEGAVTASLLGASAYVGAKTGPLTQLHGLRYKSNEHLLGSMDTKGEYKPRFFDYQTYLTLQMGRRWQIDFLGNIARNSYIFRPSSRSTSFGTMTDTRDFTVYFDGQEKDLFLTLFGNLALKYRPTSNLELQLLASSFVTRENESYDITGEYWLSDITGGNTTNVDMGAGIGSYHQHARNWLHARVANISHLGEYKAADNVLKWGLTLQQEKFKEKVAEWEMRDSAGYSIPLRSDVMAVYYNMHSNLRTTSTRVLGHVMDSYTFRPAMGRVVANGGVRANYWDWNHELIISPRASVSFFPRQLPKWGFRLASGLYYQSPFYKEMRDTVISPSGNATIELNHSIKAQRSVQMVAGADYYFHMWNRPFKLTSELYGKYIDRLISYNIDNVRIIYSGQNDGCGYVAGADFKLFGEFVKGTDSWISLSLMNARENIYGDGAGYISRPSEQRYNISMFFQDYFPGLDRFKVNLKLIWADGLPFGPPRSERKQATFRSPAYRRVDIGGTYVLRQGVDNIMQKGLLRHLREISAGVDVLNLFDINNVNSYYWVTDVNNIQYAVPNYLTGRQLNVRLSASF